MTSYTLGHRPKVTGIVPYVIPSAVSGVRVLIAFFLVMEVARKPHWVFFAAFLGVPVVILLDAVDGILARRLHSQTLIGSFIDIAADRLVEFLFLQCFIRAGLIPLWFVVVFYGRIILTDACRMRAFRAEKVSETGIILPRQWRFLVLSKLSRSAYAALKGVLFSVLLLVMYRGDQELSGLELALLFSILTFSLVRALPILLTYLPRRIEPLSLSQSSMPNLHPFAARKRRVASWVQLAYDICLATALVMLFTWH